jgi:hypothetical protein
MNGQEKRNMRWYAGRGRHFYDWYGRWWGRLEDGTEIEVRPSVYTAQFTAYLERIGRQRTSWYGIMCKADEEWQKCCCSSTRRTTWSEIMRKANNEWEEYCRLMDEFAANHQQWLAYRGHGVFIERPAIQEEIGNTSKRSS